MYIQATYDTPLNAFVSCRALGARVCRQAEMMQMCYAQNPFSTISGFYSDHYGADGQYWNWNYSYCTTDNVCGYASCAFMSYEVAVFMY